MNKSRALFLTATILISLCLGVGYGLWQERKDTTRFSQSYTTIITILSDRKLLPLETVNRIENTLSIRIRQTVIADEAELFQEIQSASSQYDVLFIPSFMAKAVLQTQQLSNVSHWATPVLKKISVDFLNLNSDLHNDYLIPYQWEHRGFQNVQQPPNSLDWSLKQFLPAKNKAAPPTFSLLISPIEIYHFLNTTNTAFSNSVRTRQKDQILKSLTELKALLNKKPADKKTPPAWVEQSSHENLKADLLYPVEQSTLWVRFIAIPITSKQQLYARKLIDLLTEKENAKESSLEANSASALQSLESEDIPAELKASYLRQLPMNRLSLQMNSSAYDPIFLEAFKTVFAEKPAEKSTDK